MNEESQCKGSWLHNFRIVGEHPTGVIEICDKCKLRKFFKVIDGKINNYEYIKWHNRQCLPPQHILYAHEYKK